MVLAIALKGCPVILYYLGLNVFPVKIWASPTVAHLLCSTVVNAPC